MPSSKPELISLSGVEVVGPDCSRRGFCPLPLGRLEYDHVEAGIDDRDPQG